MTARSLLYPETPERLTKLEKRATAYRFDLEKDPGWERAGEPGLHAPVALLRDFGVEVEKLGAYARTFDWIFAASVCRTFVLLEEFIIAFAEREKTTLLPSKSFTSLVDEEVKHVALFRRYEEVLLARHDRAELDRSYAAMGERLHARHGPRLWEVPSAADRHYLFWINTLFFEEFTVYLDERLQEASDIQPTWREMHRLHRIEEMQHLATDEAYLEALPLGEARRRELSQTFVFGFLQCFHDTLALSAAIAGAADAGCGRVCPEGGISQRPFFRHVLERSTFKRTRAAAPYLRELAEKTSQSR